jgi:hypothetical protein
MSQLGNCQLARSRPLERAPAGPLSQITPLMGSSALQPSQNMESLYRRKIKNIYSERKKVKERKKKHRQIGLKHQHVPIQVTTSNNSGRSD